MGVDNCGQKCDNKNETDCKTNGLAGWETKLLVLLGVPPVGEVKCFTLQQDLSLLVVSSIDNVINEGAVDLLVVLLLLGHVARHFVVVLQVLVAWGTALVESGAHSNNAVIGSGWVGNIVSVAPVTVI